MAMNSLREAVESTLMKLGKETTLRLVPELGAIDVSTVTTLANLLLDPNNVVVREYALLQVVKYLKEVKGLTTSLIAGEHQREMEARLSKAELRHVSRHCSTGLVLTNHPNGVTLVVIDGPSARSCEQNPNDEYLPLIGLAIGQHEGPLKTAIDDLFLSRITRGRSRNTVCTQFLAHILNLWRDIISFWLGGQSTDEEIEGDNKTEQEASRTIVEETRPKGKKRARSPEASGETSRAIKRGPLTHLSDPRAPKSVPSGHTIAKAQGGSSFNSAQTQITWPDAIRILLEAITPIKSITPSAEFDLMEQFSPRQFASQFGSGASGVCCGWQRVRRAKNFREGVGHDQIVRASNIQPFRPLMPCSSGILLELSGTNDYKRPLASGDAANDHFYTALVQPAYKGWLYCGEYRLIDQGDVSWDVLPSQVQKKWVASTFFRREHEGVKETLKAEVGAVTSKFSIERAFENGHITLRALGMQCVDYHEEIQKAIIAMNLEKTSDTLIVEQVPEDEEYSIW